MIDSIGKITLYVNNQNEARNFWTEKMGFIVRLEQQMGADQKWLEVGPEYGGGTSFVLYDKEKMKAIHLLFYAPATWRTPIEK